MIRRMEMKHRLILTACLALFALGASRSAAQELNAGAGEGARQFDEFGRVGGCDYGARLDNFAIQLQNEPTADGYIVCYGPEGEGSGSGNYALSVAKDYMVNTRGFNEERIKTIYAGHYKEWNDAATELWIAPHGAPPPEPIRYNTRPENFTGKFEEFEAWDDWGSDADGGTGPTHGNVHRASFADIVHRQANTRVWVVAYNMKGAIPGAWRRITKQLAGDFEDGYKIEAERIKIIYAGYRERQKKKEEDGEGGSDPSAFVQIWILPKDAPPPAAEVKEAEERPTEAMQLSSYNAFQMTDETEARRVFEDFADVLKNDEKLNACLIVRLLNKTEKKVTNDETPKTADAPDETATQSEVPKADLMALVEKWKADLVKDYGISEHRLVVTMGEADEWSDGAIETWIVPSGAALPDPNAKAEIEVTDETSGGYEVIAVEEGTPKEF